MAERLLTAPLSTAEVVNIGRQVAEALSAELGY